MTKKIVIAVDAKERTLDALALGRLLADATDAPVAVVAVFAYDPLSDPDAPEMVRLRDDARSTLSELAAAERLEGAETRVIAGNFAARALQRVSEERDAGLLVVGSTTRGPVGRLVVGGVGERLLTGAACPIAIAPRGYGDARARKLRCVGVGFDGSDEARRALAAAVALGRSAGAGVRLVTAFQRLAFGGVAPSALPGESVNDALRAQLRAVHHEALAEVRATVEAEGRFADGAPDEVLERESSELDLLVVGSRGYGPREAVLLGSATSRLAHTARCPLLVTPRAIAFDLLG